MIRVSKICPLNFNHRYDALSGEPDYVQKFYIGDTLIVQFYGDKGLDAKGYLNDTRVSLVEYDMGDISVYETYLNPALWDAGCFVYVLKINDIQFAVSSPFIVSSIPSDFTYLKKIQYTHDVDFYRNVLFYRSNRRRRFTLWVEGGFKTENGSFEIENEQFRNEYHELTELYSQPYNKKTLTIGDNMGVPVWIGELFNNIFSLSDVMIDGVYYRRSEAAIPKQLTIRENYPQFNYTMDLEAAYNVDDELTPDELSNWILYTGYWNDGGVWIDDAVWID